MSVRFVAAIVLLAASGCIRIADSASECVIGTCAGISNWQRSRLPKQSWDESRGHCRRARLGEYEEPVFGEVLDHWRPVAIALLANDEVLEISREKARELSGQELAGDGIVVLTRGLKDRSLHVRLDLDGCLEVASMNGSCFDLPPRAPKYAPIVVQLRERPSTFALFVYQDCI